MKKNNLKKTVNVSSVNVNDINLTKFSCAMHEENVINDKQLDKLLVVNQAKAVQIDYMSMSRVAFFRIAVKQFMLFNELARIDYRFYRDTNDRSKSQKENKHSDLLAYSRKRTHKQLNDVVKESFAQKLFSQHNLQVNTSKEYELQVNKYHASK